MEKMTMTMEEVAVKKLYSHPFLEKYGISKITDFEIEQMGKFDLPVGHVIITRDNAVIHGWDEVAKAKKMGKKLLNALIVDIEADMIIQITSMKNMRKRLSRIQQAELIVELRHYMTKVEKGIAWKDEVPGDEINKKICFLIGSSYGMTNQLERLYKYNSELLNQIDEGLLTFTEAIGMLPKMRTQPNPVENIVIPADSMELSTGGENVEAQTSSMPLIVKEDAMKNINETPATECQDCVVEADSGSSTGIHPSKVNTGIWDFAGEKKTVPCEPIEELVVRFASGREIKLFSEKGMVNGTVFGKAASAIEYAGGIRHSVDGSEFHVFKSLLNSQIQVIIYNAENLAA